MKEKRKVTENFNFKFGATNRINAVFSLDENKDEYVILLRIEKSLQGKEFEKMNPSL